MQRTRRSVLRAGAGAAAFGTLAGCLDSPLGGNEAGGGYASFFALWDWAEQVNGDEFPFENPVETGSMGHGWSPDGDLARDIAATRMFLYLDTPEFSWAQDVAAELERDYEGIRVVDAMQGLEPFLIGFDDDPIPEPDYGREFPPESLRLEEFDIVDLRSNQRVGYWHTGHWHGGVPDIELGKSVPFGVVIEDEDGYVLPLGEDEEYRLDARFADGADESVVRIESHGDHIEFHGEKLGETAVVIELWRGDDLIHDTANEASSVEVIEEYEDDGADDFHDPHVWVDPVLVQRIVDSIANELGELDPDNANLYEENAEEYNERVAEVGRQFEELIEDADKDVAVFAGHDSFQYVERRYDFELVTPTGISPDASVSSQDIADILEIIEDENIDTVLYDPFEVSDAGEEYPQMVETIFENSDVEDAQPLTAAEGTTAEWAENGWGWVEQMEKINLPSLRAALDA